MDGIQIRIKQVDKDEEVFVVRPRNIVAFERKFGKGLNELLMKEQKVEQVYWLAHNVLQSNGAVLKPFDLKTENDFLDTLEGVIVEDIPLGSGGTA